MAPTNLPNAPHFGPSYMPYRYASGRFQVYGDLNATGATRYRMPGSSAYDFSSDLPTWGHDSAPQTVEDIVNRGYFAPPRADPELALVTDKHHVASLGLDDVLHQIRHRRELYERNTYDIAQSICEASNALFRQEADQGRPLDNRQKYAGDKRKQDLYEQQRNERVTLWRDVARLRQTVPEILQQYLSAYRKQSILGQPERDTA